MKSVSSGGPVTNHFSPLRTYSPVAASRTAVACERPRVGAGVRLGDRVAAEPLAAQARLEVAAALVGVGVDQGVVGARDERPQPAGRLAELLVDEDLLEGRPALAAELDREASRRAAGRRSPRCFSVVPGSRREPAAGALELGLERLEDVDDVGRARAWSSCWAGVRVRSTGRG